MSHCQVFVGVLSRTGGLFSIPIQVLDGQQLCILVENQGRIAYSTEIKDFKVIPLIPQSKLVSFSC